MKDIKTDLGRINRQINRLYPDLKLELTENEYRRALSASAESLRGHKNGKALFYPSAMGGRVGIDLSTSKVFSPAPSHAQNQNQGKNTWMEFVGQLEASASAGSQGGEQQSSDVTRSPALQRDNRNPEELLTEWDKHANDANVEEHQRWLRESEKPLPKPMAEPRLPPPPDKAQPVTQR